MCVLFFLINKQAAQTAVGVQTAQTAQTAVGVQTSVGVHTAQAAVVVQLGVQLARRGLAQREC